MGLSFPLASSLLGWIGGYLWVSLASVDGINAKNGIDRLVFNFFHTLKILPLGLGVVLGSLWHLNQYLDLYIMLSSKLYMSLVVM